MKKIAMALLLAGCSQTGPTVKLDHNSRTLGLKTSPVRVVHYSATW
ncbi:MAG: hypothetical protein KF760_26695 [Candidatus Eremiobacteraeota bacterium]|nr:hypothetical protein [Candidatus Eremiobacteraeota bacterium]MCW5868823.1 hypothetical protein [Candidatus Eremiobacteraeota bacterium]